MYCQGPRECAEIKSAPEALLGLILAGVGIGREDGGGSVGMSTISAHDVFGDEVV